MRPSKLIQVDSKSINECPDTRWRKGARRRRSQVTMEAETGVTQPHAEKYTRSQQKCEEAEDRFSPGAFRRKKLCQEFDFRLSAPRTRREHGFCCVKLPGRG